MEVELAGPYIYQYGGRLHTVEVDEGAKVEDVLKKLGITERIYIVIIKNGKAAKLDDPLSEGDKLIVFPPVGGGA
ncbi:MAG: MoaD/ThiS family protein [Nitrososphaeria archaeon]